jgi:hypothetical protein
MVALGLVAASSHAQPITSLFATGVDSFGTPLVAGVLDPHYTVVASPGGATTAETGVLAPGFWLPADSTSQWIFASTEPDVIGNIDFQTTFTLPSDFLTASITGQFATDNEMVDVYLNWVSLGITQPNQFGFEFWTPFSILSGSDFVGGTNTLDFVINNDGGPEGLRVEMTGESSSGSSVPDANSTVLLIGAAFASLTGLRRRFAK